jgi:hypothetical protein
VPTATGHLAHATPSRPAKADARAWMKPVARVGLASRAVIYVVLSVLAYLIAARGTSPSQTSGEGALAEIAKQPAGPLLLGILSGGLVAYGAWRLVQVVTGIEPASSDRPSVWKRIGWLAIACVYFSLFAHAVSLMSGSGSSGGASSHPTPYAARVLGWPAGPELLGLAAVGIIIGGIALAIWACVHDYSETLQEGRMRPAERVGARVTGISGNVARGALVLAVGMYLLLAAIDDTPSKVKALDQLLETVVRQPAGPWWVAIAATGLAAFALYSLIEAVYRKV